MKPSELLFAAADLIDEKGWVQRKYVDKEDGGFCAIGALRMVFHRDVAGPNPYAPTTKSVYHVAFSALGEDIEPSLRVVNDREVEGSDYYGSIVRWNDAENRRKRDVVRKLRKVAARQKRIEEDETL